jgi:hypothetical protein
VSESRTDLRYVEREIAVLRARIRKLEVRLSEIGGTGEDTEPAGPAPSGLVSRDPTVFVSIASYCDPELARTLDDCIANAMNPDNLRFGICWQYDNANPVDLARFRADTRFRFIDFPAAESQGGTWARSLAQRLWSGEGYTMQVDSHMKFEPDWDAKLIAMLGALPSSKPLITMNAPLFWYDEEGCLHRETEKGIRATSIDHWSEAMGGAPWFSWGSAVTHFPARSRFISGNFVFTIGEWNQEVPQDPDHYYWGEEFNLTVRSFTHGYDFFLPSEIVVWHMCHQGSEPRRHWEHGGHVVKQKNEVAFDRLHRLLFSDDPRAHTALGQYGLGQARSKRDYELYAGMDLRNRRAHPNAFTGECPDPVTIKSTKDWESCMDYDRFVELSKKSGTQPD